MAIKGVYKFKIPALDLEKTATFKGQHTWEEVRSEFEEWLLNETEAIVEEISYTEE